MTAGTVNNPRRAAIGNALGIAAGALLVSLLGALLWAASSSAAVRTAATDYGKAEQVETIPISKQAWGDARSAMSLPPERVGELAAGDRIEAAGDFEVTVCLKSNPRHPGSGQPCVGDIYAYNPKIKAKLVLAPTATATGDNQTKAISKTVSLQCSQQQPARNHHCVVSVPWSGIKIDNPSSLPCPADACHINMLVTAYNGGAGGGDKVVLGSSDDKKRIHQGLAQLSSVRYRPGDTKPKTAWRGGRATSKLPIKSEKQGIKRKVIYSAKVSRLKAGDQLVIDAKARTSIGQHPYNVFQRTEMVFAKSKRSTKPYGKISDTTARVSSSNGFNCTQKKSAHSNVCEIRKTGVFAVKKNAKGPFYVNVVAGQNAIDIGASKWRSGDKAKVQSKGGYVKVKRYSGSSACSTCSTGWIGWGPGNKPNGGRPAKLISQLEPFGITNGAYNCAGRKGGGYVCKWRSEGRFGSSPKYQCETRADWSKNRNAFNLNVCKDALGASLWNELTKLAVPPLLPSFAGVCEEQKDGDFRCKWFADVAGGPLEGKGCKGFATYKLPEHRWVIDPCRP